MSYFDDNEDRIVNGPQPHQTIGEIMRERKNAMSAQNTLDLIGDESEKNTKIERKEAIDSSRETSKHKSAGLQTPTANAPDVSGDVGSTPAEVKINGGTDLVIIQVKTTEIVTAFSQEKGLDPVIERIKNRVRTEDMDPTTEDGRARRGSVARQIGSAKMELKRLGQTLTEDWRKQTKAVTSETSRMEAELDALRDEVLAPRIEFENREKSRVDAHRLRIDMLAALSSFPDPDYPPTSTAVQNRINQLSEYNDIDWQEFRGSATAIRERVEAQLSDMLVKIKKAEDDAIELAAFRAAEDERNQKLDAMYAEANTDNIAFDAAAKAKKDAEEEAERQRVAREEQVEADRVAAEKKAKDEQDALQAQKDESDAKVAKAEEDRIAAHKHAIKTINDLGVVPDGASSSAIKSRIDTLEVIYKRDWQEFHEEAADKFSVTRNNLIGDHTLAVDKEAADKVKADKVISDKAAADEQKRAADAQKVIDDAAAARAANNAHKAKINGAAAGAMLAAFHACTLDGDEERIKAVLIAIVQGKIPNVTISY